MNSLQKKTFIQSICRRWQGGRTDLAVSVRLGGRVDGDEEHLRLLNGGGNIGGEEQVRAPTLPYDLVETRLPTDASDGRYERSAKRSSFLHKGQN